MTINYSPDVVLYDGPCGVCRAAVSWMNGHLRPVPPARPSQGFSDDELAEWGLTRAQVERSVWWVHGTHRWSGATAVGHLLLRAGPAWSWLGVLIVFTPVRVIAHGVYRLFAWSRPHLPARWFSSPR